MDILIPMLVGVLIGTLTSVITLRFLEPIKGYWLYRWRIYKAGWRHNED